MAATAAAAAAAAAAAPQGCMDGGEKKIEKKMVHFRRFDVSDFFVRFRPFSDVFVRFRAFS